MTVLMILFTIILFLTVDFFVDRAKQRRLGAALPVVRRLSVAGARFPEDLELATNHLWISPLVDGVARVGIDEFIGRVVGPVDALDLPARGSRIAFSQEAVGLKARQRTLKLQSPLRGEIIDVNPEVMLRPQMASDDPYGRGWLMKIRVEEGATARAATRIGARARQWLREETERLKEFVAGESAQGAFVTAQDGGEPVSGALTAFDLKAWEHFQTEFLNLNGISES